MTSCRVINQLIHRDASLLGELIYCAASRGQAAEFSIEDNGLKSKGIFIGTVAGLSDRVLEQDWEATQSTATVRFYGSIDEPLLALCNVLSKFTPKPLDAPAGGMLDILWGLRYPELISRLEHSMQPSLAWLWRNRDFRFEGQTLEFWSKLRWDQLCSNGVVPSELYDPVKSISELRRTLDDDMRRLATSGGHIG